MLAMDDTGALLRFVQRPNDIDLREGEAALKARGRYSELVALYQHRGQHEAALDLLHTLTSSPQALPIPPSGTHLALGFSQGPLPVARQHVSCKKRLPQQRHQHYIVLSSLYSYLVPQTCFKICLKLQ